MVGTPRGCHFPRHYDHIWFVPANDHVHTYRECWFLIKKYCTELYLTKIALIVD